MDAIAHQIQQALESVMQLRLQHAQNPQLASAVTTLKQFQAQRFQATYADLLQNPRYQKATRFFLYELYSEKDYSQRDQQFGRIADTIVKLFPRSVVNTAAQLVQVHALTEQLDDQMARQWLVLHDQKQPLDKYALYISCWRAVSDIQARQKQLAFVLELGQSINRLTRLPGLRTMLKMMRGPASLAGLTELQQFLESGFDAFAGMRGADAFLAVVQERENSMMQMLYFGDAGQCAAELKRLFI